MRCRECGRPLPPEPVRVFFCSWDCVADHQDELEIAEAVDRLFEE